MIGLKGADSRKMQCLEKLTCHVNGWVCCCQEKINYMLSIHHPESFKKKILFYNEATQQAVFIET